MYKITNFITRKYIQNHKFNVKILKKHDIDWRYASKYRKMSEQFIKQHEEYVYWPYIITHQNLSCEFIKNYKLSPENIYLDMSLSDDEVNQYFEKIKESL